MTQLITIDGLPAHPLVVHAVVVLLPLAALCALLLAVRPAWRARYGIPVAVLTVVAVASVPVAQVTGQQLEARFAELGVVNPLITEHADRGATLLPFAVAFGVAVLTLLIADRRRWRSVTVAGSVLVVLTSVTVTALVVWIGHAGSTAVWDGIAP